MNYKNLIAGIGMFLFWLQDVNALTLLEYKSRVRGESLQAQQSDQEKEAAGLESRSGDPYFYTKPVRQRASDAG